MRKIITHQKSIDRVLSARGLLLRWDSGDSIDSVIDNPKMEAIIVEASAEIGDSDTAAEWIAVVRGDGSDERRVQLAERCQDRVNERDSSLRQPKK